MLDDQFFSLYLSKVGEAVSSDNQKQIIIIQMHYNTNSEQLS